MQWKEFFKQVRENAAVITVDECCCRCRRGQVVALVSFIDRLVSGRQHQVIDRKATRNNDQVDYRNEQDNQTWIVGEKYLQPHTGMTDRF